MKTFNYVTAAPYKGCSGTKWLFYKSVDTLGNKFNWQEISESEFNKLLSQGYKNY